MSDEDEETNSLENDPIAVAFGNLQVDDKNANGGAQGRYIYIYNTHWAVCIKINKSIKQKVWLKKRGFFQRNRF